MNILQPAPCPHRPGLDPRPCPVPRSHDEGVWRPHARRQKRGRADDAADVMRKRFTAYAEETAAEPLLPLSRYAVTAVTAARRRAGLEPAAAAEGVTDVTPAAAIPSVTAAAAAIRRVLADAGDLVLRREESGDEHRRRPAGGGSLGRCVRDL